MMKHINTFYLLPLFIVSLWLNSQSLQAQNELEEFDDYEEFDWEESEPVTSALITHDGNFEMANSVHGYWDKTNSAVVITVDAQEGFLVYQLVIQLKGGQNDLIGSYAVACGETINHGAIVDYAFDIEENFDLESLETLADFSKKVSSADCAHLANKSNPPFKVTKSVPFEEEVSGMWGQTSTQTGFYLDLEGWVGLYNKPLEKVKTFEVKIKHLRVVVL
ncbi:MAG: hypothetical protein R2728_15750 [Chitinophagales bacterium]